MNTEDRDARFPRKTEEREEIKRYGGYDSRQQYEQRNTRVKRLWVVLSQSIILALLLFLAVMGVIALARGDFFPDRTVVDDGSGTIKVPTKKELSEVIRTPEEALTEASISLVTAEVVLEDGSVRYGSGFLLSEDGFALCSDALLSGISPVREIRAHTVEGIAYSAVLEGTVPELGFALIRLEGAFGASPISVGNFTFVKRGETLYAAAASNIREFRGTALSGIVASTGDSVKITVGDKSASVPVMFLDMAPNESIWGAPVVDLTGSAVGFCSPAVSSPYGDLVAVVSIHVVYTMVNEMLAD